MSESSSSVITALGTSHQYTATATQAPVTDNGKRRHVFVCRQHRRLTHIR